MDLRRSCGNYFMGRFKAPVPSDLHSGSYHVFLFMWFVVWLFYGFKEVKIFEVFGLIFTEAFGLQAACAGAVGHCLREVMRIGVRRAAFSNEAGMGTAPMAHSNARTPEPVSEGFVALVGPFFDTIIVCTMTALVILTSLPEGVREQSEGIVMTVTAFEHSFPQFGKYLLGVAVFLFSFTTIVGTANYNQKCWNFLFRGESLFRADHKHFCVLWLFGFRGHLVSRGCD